MRRSSGEVIAGWRSDKGCHRYRHFHIDSAGVVGGGLIQANGNCDLFRWEPLNGSFSSRYLILAFNYVRRK